MNSPQTIVKQRVREKSGWRGSVGPSTGTAGQMVAEQMRVEVPPDRLRVRAYEIYLARRDAPEDAESDWVRAERELKGRADGAPGPESRSTDPVSVEFEASTDDSRQRVSLARSGQ